MYYWLFTGRLENSLGWSRKMQSKDLNSLKGASDPSTALKDGLVKFFGNLERAARTKLILKFLLLIIFFLGSSWMSLCFSDRIWETTTFGRTIILMFGMILSAWAAWKLYIYSFYLTRHDSWLAKSVRKIYRAKGERLLGIIEIAEKKPSSNPSFSTQIFEAAQQKMLGEIDSIEIERVYPWKMIRYPAILAGAISVIIFVFCFSFPDLGKNSFYRWALPFSSLERKTLTDFLDVEERDLYFVRNESNTMRFSLSQNSKRKPRYANLNVTGYADLNLITPNNGNVYEFRLPPQKQEFSAILQSGDYSKGYNFKPIERPKLESISASIEFPEYLSQDPLTYEALNQTIDVPKNSKISLRGKVNREISRLLITNNQVHIGKQPNSRNFDLRLQELQDDQSFEIHIVDQFGFSQRAPGNLSIKVQEDLPPSVNVDIKTDTSPVLIFETRRIDFLHADDFGLSEISLTFKIAKPENKAPEQELFRKTFPTSGTKSFELSFPFDPKIFEVGDGDEIVFFATSKDHYPERDSVISKPLKLKIIGPEKHAEMIRTQMDMVIAEVSEITRSQEATQFETLAAETKINSQDNKELGPKSVTEISNLRDDQKELSSMLKTTASTGLETLNEATKNPLFDTDLLKEFANSIKEMQNTSQNSMRDAGKKLNTASTSDSQQASQSMMQAAEFQQKALDDLRDILANFSKQLDDLEAITLAERLRKLKRTEQKLSQKLVSLMPSSIGRMTTQLKNENRVSVYEMEKIQTTVSLDAEEIKNEISRYHERTNKAEYGEVSRLMNQAKTKEQLGVVAQSLRNNISFQALNGLNQWEELFELWAQLLQAESPGGDSPGGKAGGKDKTADILALLKIRKIQSEILFKTKNLDRQGFRGNKEKWASSLTNQQDTLMIDLTDTQISMAEEAMNPLFDDAHMAMAKSSEQLSNQVFDEVTQSAQEESKEILSDLINLLIEGQGKGNQPNASENLTAMELLMMQMANQKPGQAKGKSPMAGKSGGGSSQGGTTDKTINSLNGNTSTPTNIGTSSQSSGSGGPSIAPEFQEVMEKYFKAIED